MEEEREVLTPGDLDAAKLRFLDEMAGHFRTLDVTVSELGGWFTVEFTFDQEHCVQLGPGLSKGAACQQVKDLFEQYFRKFEPGQKVGN